MRAGSEPDKTYTERKDKRPPKVSAQEKSLFLELTPSVLLVTRNRGIFVSGFANASRYCQVLNAVYMLIH